MRPGSLLTVVIALGAFLVVAWSGDVRAETPLLQEGKSRLFERVVLRGDLPMLAQPGGGRVAGDAAALTPWFVFERIVGSDGAEWLRLGSSENGGEQFWAPAAETIVWRQTIVMKFTTLGDFDRLMFFDDLDPLYDLVESEGPAEDADVLRRRALAAEQRGGDAAPVLALGPELGVDLKSHFYLVPIIEHQEAIFERAGFVNLLKVAVASTSARGDGGPTAPQSGGGGEESLADFSAGVVFVVDTTRSMGRYFDPVRRAVADIFGNIGTSPAARRMSFGLIGFRDAVDGGGATEYLTRTFVTLQQGADPKAFLGGLDSMREAADSTKNFDEDSYAGVLSAVDSLDWEGIDAGFIVLITDAGPREAGDALSATGMSARRLADYAKQKRNLHVATLHLMTPAGQADHAYAGEAYEALSSVNGSDPLYFPVESGDPATLEATARMLSGSLASMIELAQKGRRIDPDAYRPPAGSSPEQQEFVKRALRVAKSLQLDFLGTRAGAKAPDVFDAWIADRDFRNRGAKPVEVRLLVSRSQLSDLEESLAVIVQQAEASMLEPREFFGRVIDAAARMSRRPDQVARAAGEVSLADAALISEMLDGLPYRSQIMNLTEGDWLRLPIARQTELTDLIMDKIERYDQASRIVDNWVLLDARHSPDDAVFPMSLEDLP